MSKYLNKHLITKVLVALYLIVVNTITDCNAQSLTMGRLDFFGEQNKLNVVFNYDKLTILGMPEKDYLEFNTPQFREEWENAKAKVFKESFLLYLNKNINIDKIRIFCGEYPDAIYTATVNVLAITRNFELVTYEIVFSRNDNNTFLAKISLESQSRGIGGVRAGNSIYKTRTAFSYAGQNLGKYMVKKVKWEKKK